MISSKSNLKKMKLFVISCIGIPLMPTTPRNARLLLKNNQATIALRTPFTIQLNYSTGVYKQPITLGIDAGFKHIGYSAVTDKCELIGGEVELLEGMTERITERSKYRKVRRNRLRHRAPRFNNRRRIPGWLSPSIQHRYDAHVKLIKRIKSILPVTKTIIETANFDIQKINNPDIETTEYQEGVQLGYLNLTSYIRHRDGYKCQNKDCKNKSKDIVLQVHHLGFWLNPPDRSNRPGNLITLCDKCHTSSNHKKGKLLFGWKPKVKSFRAETFMSTIHKKLLEEFDAEQAYGYETKFKREKLNLDKSHHNDAFCIANGTVQTRSKSLILEEIRRNKRSMEQFYDAKYLDIRTGDKTSGSILCSGRRTRNTNISGENLRVYRGTKLSKGQRRIKTKRYAYNPNDYVMFENNKYRVIGMQNLGTGVKIANYPGVTNKVVQRKYVKSIKRRAGMCERIN